MMMLRGTPQQMADELQRRRDDFGTTYISVNWSLLKRSLWSRCSPAADPSTTRTLAPPPPSGGSGAPAACSPPISSTSGDLGQVLVG